MRVVIDIKMPYLWIILNWYCKYLYASLGMIEIHFLYLKYHRKRIDGIPLVKWEAIKGWTFSDRFLLFGFEIARSRSTSILFNSDNREFARIIGSIDFDDLNFIEWLKKYN